MRIYPTSLRGRASAVFLMGFIVGAHIALWLFMLSLTARGAGVGGWDSIDFSFMQGDIALMSSIDGSFFFNDNNGANSYSTTLTAQSFASAINQAGGPGTAVVAGSVVYFQDAWNQSVGGTYDGSLFGSSVPMILDGSLSLPSSGIQPVYSPISDFAMAEIGVGEALVAIGPIWLGIILALVVICFVRCLLMWHVKGGRHD